MGLDICPYDIQELAEEFKLRGNLPSAMKERWQRLKD
jgi:hypothetical protein